jgi:threonylcarbamoyladenosine tRNA methylthiotransferase MtaB
VGQEEQAREVAYRGTVVIHTLGCKLNQADSNVLARRFVEAGYRLVDSVAQADVFVLNTCTVTAAADAKARQILRAARRANPKAFIVATGCYAQRAAAELTRLGGVSLVAGNSQKDRLVSLVMQGHDRKESPAPFPPAPVALGTSIGRTRGMIKIQEGCNQVCAYCIVPKVRGRERSIPPEVLVRQIDQQVAEGYREVVLTGTQLGTYGFDIPGVNLVGLLQRVLAETRVPRLRVSSLQAQEISPVLLELWGDRRLCPHFHVPLQSGSDRVLRAMRRRYDTARFASTVELIRRTVPEASITTDLIVGFPGEDDAEFQASRDFARSMQFSDMHIFPFSPRPGTSAGYLRDRVPAPTMKGRAAEMQMVATRGFQVFRSQQLGQVRPVLWEHPRVRSGIKVYPGLTDNYIRVYTDGDAELSDAITPARLVALVDDWVYVRQLG